MAAEAAGTSLLLNGRAIGRSSAARRARLPVLPGFYKHVIDTIGSIPSFDGRAVADHLVPTTHMAITQYGKPTFRYRWRFRVFRTTQARCCATYCFHSARSLTSHHRNSPSSAPASGRSSHRASSDASRNIERTSWWEFVGAEQRSTAYQKFLADGITRSLVAAKARRASTRTIGDIFVQLMLTIVNPSGESTDRVLDGPTNLVWIDPWRRYLEARGVRYVTEAEVEEIHCNKGSVACVAVRQGGKRIMVGTNSWPRCRLSALLPW